MVRRPSTIESRPSGSSSAPRHASAGYDPASGPESSRPTPPPNGSENVGATSKTECGRTWKLQSAISCLLVLQNKLVAIEHRPENVLQGKCTWINRQCFGLLSLGFRDFSFGFAH